MSGNTCGKISRFEISSWGAIIEDKSKQMFNENILAWKKEKWENKALRRHWSKEMKVKNEREKRTN